MRVRNVRETEPRRKTDEIPAGKKDRSEDAEKIDMRWDRVG